MHGSGTEGRHAGNVVNEAALARSDRIGGGLFRLEILGKARRVCGLATV